MSWFGESTGPVDDRGADRARRPGRAARERGLPSGAQCGVHVGRARKPRSPERRFPPGLEIEPLRDVAALADAFTGAEALDDDPEQRERRLALLASTAGAGPLRHHAARLHGRPVGIVSAFAAPPALVLTDLAVAARERRQGIGRALVVHALHDASTHGCRLALLDPTPATVPFYEALGFALERFPPGRGFYLP